MKFDNLQIYNRNYSDIRLGLINLYTCQETNKIYAEKQFQFKSKDAFQKKLDFYQQRLEIKKIPILQILKIENDVDKLEIKIIFDYPQNDLFDFYEDLQNIEKLEIFLIQALQAINFLDQLGQVHGNVRHEFFQYQKSIDNFQLIDNFDNQRYSKDKAQDNFEDLIFLSPQYFNSLVNKNKFEGSLIKEDIFCLGLIVLYLLCDIDDIISIFDFDNKNFNSKKLQQIKSQITFQNNQIHLETLIKDHLLLEDEDKRINPQEALEILLKHNNKQKSVANYSFDYSRNWVQELQGSDTTYVKKSLRSINNLNKLSFNKDKEDSIQKLDKKQIEQNYLSYKYIEDKKDQYIQQAQSNLRSLDNLQETIKKSQQKIQNDSNEQQGELLHQELKPDSKKFDKYSFGYFSQNLSENKQSKTSDLMASKLDQQNHLSNDKTFQNNSLQNQSKEQIFRSTVQQKQSNIEQITNFNLNQNDNLLSSDVSQENEEILTKDQNLELILKSSNSLQQIKDSQQNQSNTNQLSQINKSSLNDIQQSQNKQSISQDTQNNKDYQININYGLLSEEPSEKGVKQNQQNNIIKNYPQKNLLTHEFENMDLLSIEKSESDLQKQRFREQEIKSFQQMQQIQKAPLLDTQFYEDDTIKQSKIKKTLGFGRNKNSKRSQFFDHQIETGGESYLDGSMSIIVNKNISKMGGLNKNSEQRFQAMYHIISRDNSFSQINNDSMKELSQTPTNNSIKEEDMESQIDDPKDLELTSNNNSSIQPQKKYSNPTRNLDHQFFKQIPKKRMSENIQMVQQIQIFQRPSRKSAMNNLLQKEVNSLKSSFSNLEIDDIGNTLLSTKKDFDYQHLQKDIDKYVRDYFSEQQQISRAESKKIQNKILDQIIDKNPFKRRRSSKQLKQIKLMVNSRVNVELVHKKKFSLKESSSQLRPRIDTIKEESLDINASDIRPKTNRFKFVEQIDKEIDWKKDFNFVILKNDRSNSLQQNLQR